MGFVEQRKKKHGDRLDGHLVKDAPLLNKLTAALYPNRCDNEVSSTTDMDITNLMNYIKARKEKDPNCQIKFFHCFIAALTRVINEKRLLLRFVQSKKIYEKDTIRISFIAKRKFSEKAEESIITYIAKKDDNVDSVTNFVINEVNGARKNGNFSAAAKNGKSQIDTLNKFPNFVVRFVARFLRFIDKRGIVIKGSLREDPSFATALLSNLGSIGSKSVYHHLNNYGSCSLIITIGRIVEKEVKMPDGHMENRTFVDLTATFDERMADGFYFINAVKLLEQYLQHPEVLEKPFEEEVTF